MSNLVFSKMVQEGNAYKIGFERGEVLSQIPSLVKFMTELPEGMVKPSPKEVEDQLDFLETWCPGSKDELAGLAEGMQVSIAELLHMYVIFPTNSNRTIDASNQTSNKSTEITYATKPANGCSLITVLPNQTQDGHVLMARNYEYGVEDELIYSVTRCEGKLSHAGFSLLQIGRFDGMNEKGLCVAMATCECVHSSIGEGIGVMFYIAIRSVLDWCSTTQEALEYLKKVPICNNVNIMITDRLGDSAVVEVLNVNGESRKAIRRGKSYLYAVNHYQSKEQTVVYPQVRQFSKIRADCIEEYFAKANKVNLSDLKQLLTTTMPNGLCCHAYHDWFGTLRSMLFDVTESKMWVVLGSPQTGTWFEADLNEPCKMETYSIPYVNEDAIAGFFDEC